MLVRLILFTQNSLCSYPFLLQEPHLSVVDIEFCRLSTASSENKSRGDLAVSATRVLVSLHHGAPIHVCDWWEQSMSSLRHVPASGLCLLLYLISALCPFSLCSKLAPSLVLRKLRCRNSVASKAYGLYIPVNS